jgi:hypothetical protein
MIRQKVDSSIILVDQNQNKTRKAFRQNHKDRVISTTKLLPPYGPVRYATRRSPLLPDPLQDGVLGRSMGDHQRRLQSRDERIGSGFVRSQGEGVGRMRAFKWERHGVARTGLASC